MVKPSFFSYRLRVSSEFPITVHIVVFFELEIYVVEDWLVDAFGPVHDRFGEGGNISEIFVADEGDEDGISIDKDSTSATETFY